MKFVRTSAALVFALVLAAVAATLGYLVGRSHGEDAGARPPVSSQVSSPQASSQPDPSDPPTEAWTPSASPSSSPGATTAADTSADAGEQAEPVVTQDLRWDVVGSRSVRWHRTLPTSGTGQYAVTWSANLEGLAGVSSTRQPLKLECYVVQATSTAFGDRTFYTADDSASTRGAGEVSMSGAGVVDLADGDVVDFECELNNGIRRDLAWSTNAAEPIQVTLTPLTGYERVSD